jgi:hypothetical protein
MDGTRFDELTRMIGSGLNRRQVLRGLVGGAGALAVTGATRQFASAQLCAVREDCVNVQQPTCPTLCPEGSQPGNNRGLTGTCCTGNGTCCSNICSNGVCVDELPICVDVVGGDCSELPCCDGLACSVEDDTCVEQECQTVGEICEVDENCCDGLICGGGLCVIEACLEEGADCAPGECCDGLVCFEGLCLPCSGGNEFCETSDDCCGVLICVDSYCAEPDDCLGLGAWCEDSAECCDDLLCINSYCGYKLPDTGVADGSSDSSGLLTTAIAGGAAALVAAKVLRHKPETDTASEG